MTAAISPVSKPPLFAPDHEDDRTRWWCSDCKGCVDGPWHVCGEAS